MVKVIINKCYGGFSLSYEAIELYKELTGKVILPYVDDIERHDSFLVQVIERLGERASRPHCSDLIVCEINSDRYIIDDYDGMETIVTPDSIDWIIVENNS